ncbi:MAG: hypothetical protein ACK50S_00565 [bacterium]|jgi:hypothetical protein
MRPARPLAVALAESAAAALLHRLERWRAIATLMAPAAAAIAPDFPAGDPRACELRGDVLILNAGSAAQAAKLRQGIPGLLRLLHQQGTQVTEIRVRVQPAGAGDAPDAVGEPFVTKTHPAPPDPLPAGASEGARALAERLVQTLPPSPLRAQAERLRDRLDEQRRRGQPVAAAAATTTPRPRARE